MMKLPASGWAWPLLRPHSGTFASSIVVRCPSGGPALNANAVASAFHDVRWKNTPEFSKWCERRISPQQRPPLLLVGVAEAGKPCSHGLGLPVLESRRHAVEQVEVALQGAG